MIQFEGQNLLFDLLEEKIKSLPSNIRRLPLTKSMKELGEDGINCHQCEGTCCTFVSNSMMISPLEAYDLVSYLVKQNGINKELIEKLEENIDRYRLTFFYQTKASRSYVRHTYTCPFFASPPKGCSIGRQSKPYGCLAFNPKAKNQLQGGECYTSASDLEARESANGKDEIKLNDYLKKELSIDWSKAPIPLGVLDMIKKIGLIA